MEVEYTLGIDEVLALSLYHNEHSPLLRRRLWILRGLVPLACLVVWLLLAATREDAGFVITLGAVLALVSLIYFVRYPGVVRKRTMQMVRKLYAESPNRGAFGQRRMTINAETITEAGELTVTTKKWAAIDRIVEDHGHAYFYVSALSAFILPKAAFASDGAFREFLETARRHHREAPP